jgi:hypothetical protein
MEKTFKDIYDELIDKQIILDGYYNEFVNENFWDLINENDELEGETD